MPTLKILVSAEPDTPTFRESADYIGYHYEIIDEAPTWARAIRFTSIESLDAGAAFAYVFEDERFEVTEHYRYAPGEGIVYGYQPVQDNEPDVSCKGDALLELVTNYIEENYP